MITITQSIRAEKPIDAVWDLFNNMETLTACVPQCESSRILDEDHFDVHLRLKLGIIPLENTFHMAIADRVAPRHIVTEGIGEAGEGLARAAKLGSAQSETKLVIAMDLEALSPTETLVHCRIDAEAAGGLKRIYEGIIRGQRAKLEASFVENVRSVLGCPVQLVDVGYQPDASLLQRIAAPEPHGGVK